VRRDSFTRETWLIQDEDMNSLLAMCAHALSVLMIHRWLMMENGPCLTTSAYFIWNECAVSYYITPLSEMHVLFVTIWAIYMEWMCCVPLYQLMSYAMHVPCLTIWAIFLEWMFRVSLYITIRVSYSETQHIHMCNTWLVNIQDRTHVLALLSQVTDDRARRAAAKNGSPKSW